MREETQRKVWAQAHAVNVFTDPERVSVSGFFTFTGEFLKYHILGGAL